MPTSWKGHANNARTTLASGLAAGDTTASCVDLSRFPAAPFRAELWDRSTYDAADAEAAGKIERVLVGGVSGNSANITRGQEGTTAQTWGAGVTFANMLTADDLGDPQRAINTLEANNTGVNTGDETAQRIGNIVNAATAKTTPVDADLLAVADSVASWIVKALSWSNVKATLKAYFDTIYTLASLGGVPTSRKVAGHALTGDVTVAEADLAFSDVTTNNVSITEHGFAPKGTNVGHFLRDDGAWATPPGSGAVAADITELSSTTNTATPAWNGSNPTFVSWDVAVSDGLGIYSALNKTLVTIAATGIYDIMAMVDIAASSTYGWFKVSLLKNSTTWGYGLGGLIPTIIPPNANADLTLLLVAPAQSLTAGDILRVPMISSSAAALTGNPNATAKLWIRKIG